METKLFKEEKEEGVKGGKSIARKEESKYIIHDYKYPV